MSATSKPKWTKRFYMLRFLDAIVIAVLLILATTQAQPLWWWVLAVLWPWLEPGGLPTNSAGGYSML